MFDFKTTEKKVADIILSHGDHAPYAIAKWLEAQQLGLTQEQVANIWTYHARGYSGARIAELIGTTPYRVYKIIGRNHE